MCALSHHLLLQKQFRFSLTAAGGYTPMLTDRIVSEAETHRFLHPAPLCESRKREKRDLFPNTYVASGVCSSDLEIFL